MNRAAFVLMRCTLVLGLAAVLGAPMYVRVEPDGTKTYSDKPIPGGKLVELDVAPPSSSAPTKTATQAGPRAAPAAANFQYAICRVASPKSDETFINAESVTVSLQLEPQLRTGDQIFLLVDGQRVGGPATATFTIAPVFRGTHTVTATIRDAVGTTLCQSPSLSFHVRQLSIYAPPRQKPKSAPRRG
jgi:hypothetical protein